MWHCTRKRFCSTLWICTYGDEEIKLPVFGCCCKDIQTVLVEVSGGLPVCESGRMICWPILLSWLSPAEQPGSQSDLSTYAPSLAVLYSCSMSSFLIILCCTNHCRAWRTFYSLSLWLRTSAVVVYSTIPCGFVLIGHCNNLNDLRLRCWVFICPLYTLWS